MDVLLEGVMLSSRYIKHCDNSESFDNIHRVDSVCNIFIQFNSDICMHQLMSIMLACTVKKVTIIKYKN